MRQALGNLGSFVLALLLAFTVWILATFQADPFDEEDVANVPIQVINQPTDTIQFQEIAERVSVRVRAPQSVLRELEVSDFDARVDLGDVPLGEEVSVPISVTTSVEAARIQSVNPSAQTVQIEPILTRTVPVAIEVTGEVATGYLAMSPVIAPSEVTVRGPAPYLTSVVTMTGSLDLAGAREPIVQQVALSARNAENQIVPDLEWSPERVDVRIGVRRRVGYKPDVEVVPDLRGDPAPGYRLGNVTITPSTVTLTGLPSVLNDLPGFVETLPISVTNATQNLTRRQPLTVPTSVAVVGGNFVTVTVEVLAIQSSRALTDVVEIQGLRQGWVATPSPEVVDVILEGPDAVLSELTRNDVQIMVNVVGRALGLHRIPPDVLAPEGVTVVSVIPETIEVSISAPVTPTVPAPPGEETPAP
jgi:YbbR domain-containing protein